MQNLILIDKKGLIVTDFEKMSFCCFYFQQNNNNNTWFFSLYKPNLNKIYTLSSNVPGYSPQPCPGITGKIGI